MGGRLASLTLRRFSTEGGFHCRSAAGRKVVQKKRQASCPPFGCAFETAAARDDRMPFSNDA